MRSALWLVGLFAAAVALALFVGGNHGSVAVFWPPYRVTLSLNLVLLLLLALFALLYGALRALAALRALPVQARRWRMQQRERSAHALLMQALLHQQAGRHARARAAAEAALARGQALSAQDDALPHGALLCWQAALAAADSAHALRDSAGRDRHWQQALQLADHPAASAEWREATLLTATRWALQEHDPATASARLQALPPGAARRIAARQLQWLAATQSGQHDLARHQARLLARHGALSPQVAGQGDAPPPDAAPSSPTGADASAPTEA